MKFCPGYCSCKKEILWTKICALIAYTLIASFYCYELTKNCDISPKLKTEQNKTIHNIFVREKRIPK